MLSNVLTCASKEWRLIPENFMLRLNKPANSPARTWRISDEVAKQIAYVAITVQIARHILRHNG